MQISDKSNQLANTKKEPSSAKLAGLEPMRPRRQYAGMDPRPSSDELTPVNRLARAIATMNPVTTGSPRKYLHDARRARSAVAALNGDWLRVSGDLWNGVLKSAAPSSIHRDTFPVHFRHRKS